MEISGTLELVTETSSNINGGDIMAIFVSVLSLIGVFISTFMTNRTTKKINKENSKLQEKWNQKNIDANLIAQARIEWIQNVRKTTSELLVHYFSMINFKKLESIDQELLEAQEKNELLILYFGNDSNERNYPRERLLFEENNEGKNNLIVELLEELARDFSDFSRDVKNKRYEHLEKALEEAREKMYHNVTFEEIGMEFTDEGVDIPIQEPVYDLADIEEVIEAKIPLEKEEKKIEGLQNKLAKMPEEAQSKLQETLQRIVNEGSGGLICIIL